jgi:hypothetical protein
VSPAEQEYAHALAAAIVASLQRDPVEGKLARLVIRWFEGPDYLTIHALGTDEEPNVSNEDAWYPLEWPNAAREITRVDGVMQDESLARSVERLAAELDDGGWDWDAQPGPLIAAAQEIHALVEANGIPVAPHFASGVSHFEGWGPHESVARANPEPVLARLAQGDLLPVE